jgi:hypothetical protein
MNGRNYRIWIRLLRKKLQFLFNSSLELKNISETQRRGEEIILSEDVIGSFKRRSAG